MWVTGVDRDEPGLRGAVVAAKDTEEAQAAIDKGVKEDGKKVKERTYEDVDYQVDEDGAAAGIVGDFFTVGTEPEFKRTVKAKGDALADDKRFKGDRRRARGRPRRALLRRHQAGLRAGDQADPEAAASSSRSARSSRSTSSSRWAARCWPTATGSRSTR